MKRSHHHHTKKHPQTNFPKIILFVMLIIIAVILVYPKTGSDEAAVSFSPSTVSSLNTPMTTTVKIKPSTLTKIVGYHFVVTFDPQKVRVTDIQYLLGNMSIGLGDDSSRLDEVNRTGILNIQAELYEPEGQTITSKNPLEVASITFIPFTKTVFPLFLDLKKSSFIKLSADSSLSEISLSYLK